MSDFEPVFRDGIGYCTDTCCKWRCPHTPNPSISREDAVCIPWVRSLLKAETTEILYIQRGPDLDDNMQWWVWEDHIRNKNPVMSSFARSAETRLEALNKALRWSKGKYPIKELPEDSGKPAKQPTPPDEEARMAGNLELMKGTSIPDEKVREAVEWLESEVYGVPGLTEVWSEKIRTVIDAYRARNPKGTPMSTDNVIYVQRRGTINKAAAWYAWEDTASNESPEPPERTPVRGCRDSALCRAHDLAKEIQPSHGVQELPPEAPDKTQAQRDAELLRAIVSRLLDGHAVYCKDAERLNAIADRLEST